MIGAISAYNQAANFTGTAATSPSSVSQGVSAFQKMLNVAEKAYSGSQVNDIVSISSSNNNSVFSLIQDTAANTVASLRQAEDISIKGITGKANTADVVAKVTEAEIALSATQTVLSKVLSAYQELIRMGI